MHRSESVARVERQCTVLEVVAEMTRRPLGAACVLARNEHLEGLITEYDCGARSGQTKIRDRCGRSMSWPQAP